MQPASLAGLTLAETHTQARERLPGGVGAAAHIYRSALCDGVFPAPKTGLQPRNLAAWQRHFALRLPEIVEHRTEDSASSIGGRTEKLVLQDSSGRQFETVRIPMGRDRESLCLSTQIGCGQACRFCETGMMGLLRNLHTDEIVGQVVQARLRGWQPRSLVFMGMGEALDNFANLRKALAVLMDPGGLCFSQQRITVCSVGHADGIRRLAQLGYRRLNLSFSLNAANDELRQQLMPISKHFALNEVQDALIEFRRRDNLQLGINYCLMPGINDGRDHARQIAAFCRPLGRVMIYLIGYNPGSHPLTRAPESDELQRFVGWLRDDGLPVRLRVTKGRDLMAACGQLGNVALRRRRREAR